MRSNILAPTSAVAIMAACAFSASAGLTTSTYSVVPNVWSGTPVLANTLTPDTDSTVSNGGGQNTAAAITFTTGASGFKLDKFAFVAAGGPSQGFVHLYQSPVGGGESDGFLNVSFSIDLLGGGAGLPFTFFGTGSEVAFEFDLSGADEINLAANTRYALDFTASPADPTYNLFIRRGGAFYTGGGNIYVNGNVSGSPVGERYDVVGGARRDAPLALYSVVPEPTSAVLLGMGGFLMLNHIRRRTQA